MRAKQIPDDEIARHLDQWLNAPANKHIRRNIAKSIALTTGGNFKILFPGKDAAGRNTVAAVFIDQDSKIALHNDEEHQIAVDEQTREAEHISITSDPGLWLRMESISARIAARLEEVSPGLGEVAKRVVFSGDRVFRRNEHGRTFVGFVIGVEGIPMHPGGQGIHLYFEDRAAFNAYLRQPDAMIERDLEHELLAFLFPYKHERIEAIQGGLEVHASEIEVAKVRTAGPIEGLTQRHQGEDRDLAGWKEELAEFKKRSAIEKEIAQRSGMEKDTLEVSLAYQIGSIMAENDRDPTHFFEETIPRIARLAESQAELQLILQMGLDLTERSVLIPSIFDAIPDRAIEGRTTEEVRKYADAFKSTITSLINFGCWPQAPKVIEVAETPEELAMAVETLKLFITKLRTNAYIAQIPPAPDDLRSVFGEDFRDVQRDEISRSALRLDIVMPMFGEAFRLYQQHRDFQIVHRPYAYQRVSAITGKPGVRVFRDISLQKDESLEILPPKSSGREIAIAFTTVPDSMMPEIEDTSIWPIRLGTIPEIHGPLDRRIEEYHKRGSPAQRVLADNEYRKEVELVRTFLKNNRLTWLLRIFNDLISEDTQRTHIEHSGETLPSISIIPMKGAPLHQLRVGDLSKDARRALYSANYPISLEAIIDIYGHASSRWGINIAAAGSEVADISRENAIRIIFELLRFMGVDDETVRAVYVSLMFEGCTARLTPMLIGDINSQVDFALEETESGKKRPQNLFGTLEQDGLGSRQIALARRSRRKKLYRNESPFPDPNLPITISEVASIYETDAILTNKIANTGYLDRRTRNKRYTVSVRPAVVSQDDIKALREQAAIISARRNIDIIVVEQDSDEAAAYVFSCTDDTTEDTNIRGRTGINLEGRLGSLDRTLGILNLGLLASTASYDIQRKAGTHKELAGFINLQYRNLDALGRNLIEEGATVHEIFAIVQNNTIEVLLPSVIKPEELTPTLEAELERRALEQYL